MNSSYTSQEENGDRLQTTTGANLQQKHLERSEKTECNNPGEMNNSEEVHL